MQITKLSDSAIFVPSYSTQTITPAYDTSVTIQTFTAALAEPEPGKDEQQMQKPVVEPPKSF